MTTKTVAELEEELRIARERESASRRERQEAFRKAWDEFVTTKPWVYQIKLLPAYRDFCSKEPPTEAIKVDRMICPLMLATFMKNWPEQNPSDGLSSWQSDLCKWHGMIYYRTDENILTHGGGGTYVLKDPKLCSDEEWATLKSGVVPPKFQR